MAIVKALKAKKAKRLNNYLLAGKPKENENDVRERVLMASGKNLDLSDRDPDRVTGQMASLRDLAGKGDKVQEIHHFVQSFSKEEFDFNDSLDVMRAHELGLALAEAVGGKDAQYMVVTQADNKSGLLHNHIVENSVLMNGKSMQTNRVSVKNLRKMNDQVLRDHFLEQPDILKNTDIYERKSGAVTSAEQEINARGEKTKKDIMREKLDMALSEAKSVDEFESILQENDVELVRGKRKKQEIFKYREDGESRSMTDRALGENYSIDAVLQQIQANFEREKRKKEEEREKEKKKKELEDSISGHDEPKSDDFEDVQEAEPIQEPEKEKSSLDKLWESEVTGLSAKKRENVRVSLDDLFKETKSLKNIDTRKSGYSGSRVPQNDFDLEL